MILISFKIYLNMMIPNFNIFTNECYDVVGLMWFGRLFGICIKSGYNHIIEENSFVNLKEYHLKTDINPQFVIK